MRVIWGVDTQKKLSRKQNELFTIIIFKDNRYKITRIKFGEEKMGISLNILTYPERVRVMRISTVDRRSSISTTNMVAVIILLCPLTIVYVDEEISE